MFISLQALIGFIPEFYMKREASLQLLSENIWNLTTTYRISLPLAKVLKIFLPFIKMAINQNSAITVLSLWLVLSANSWKKKL